MTHEQAINALITPNPKGTAAEEGNAAALRFLGQETGKSVRAGNTNYYRAAVIGSESLSLEIGRPLSRHEYVIFANNVVIGSRLDSTI